MGKIHMRLAASSTPIAMKRRAMDPVYTAKIFPVLLTYIQEEPRSNLRWVANYPD
jgi:hypothetical protein